MPETNAGKIELRPTLAELLAPVLESTKETVANLNEALAPKSILTSFSTPTPEQPLLACPADGKSS